MAYFKEMEVTKKPRGMGLDVAIQVAKIAKCRIIDRRGAGRARSRRRYDGAKRDGSVLPQGILRLLRLGG